MAAMDYIVLVWSGVSFVVQAIAGILALAYSIVMAFVDFVGHGLGVTPVAAQGTTLPYEQSIYDSEPAARVQCNALVGNRQCLKTAKTYGLASQAYCHLHQSRGS